MCHQPLSRRHFWAERPPLRIHLIHIIHFQKVVYFIHFRTRKLFFFSHRPGKGSNWEKAKNGEKGRGGKRAKTSINDISVLAVTFTEIENYRISIEKTVKESFWSLSVKHSFWNFLCSQRLSFHLSSKIHPLIPEVHARSEASDFTL